MIKNSPSSFVLFVTFVVKTLGIYSERRNLALESNSNLVHDGPYPTLPVRACRARDSLTGSRRTHV